MPDLCPVCHGALRPGLVDGQTAVRSCSGGCTLPPRPPRAKVIPGLGRIGSGPELELSPDLPEGGSKWERCLLQDIRKRGLPDPQMEYPVVPSRQWRFDLAWPEIMLAVECEGGLWMKGGGRHNRPDGYEKDARKYNAGAIEGWLILRYSGDMIQRGEAIREIEQVYRWRESHVR